MDTHEEVKEKTTSGEGEAPKVPSPQEVQKAALLEAERIRDLRQRLYSRGDSLSQVGHHLVPPQVTPVTQKSATPPVTEQSGTSENPDVPSLNAPLEDTVSYTTKMKRRRSFRKIVASIGLLFFIGAAAVASFIMFAGNNTISGDNITLSVTGQNTVGAGEVLPFQVAVSNQNGVPVQSATLIIEYPDGTQSATDGKELSIERKQLDTIGSGELINVELDARVFGEENQDREIRVSIDYRISGSNATFHKEAEPLYVKIGTSPVVVTFNALKAVSAGEEYVLPLTIQSNANVPLTDMLVKMSYPNGFDFSESDPETVSGEDVWRIATLKPGEKKVITVKGIMTGRADDSFKFTALVGNAQKDNKNTLSSIFAQAESEVVIEEPFLKSEIAVNGRIGDTIVITKNEAAGVRITLLNTLDTIIYDARVSVEVQGNAFNEFSIFSSEGYYNSSKNTISWDSTDTQSLKEILPGQKSYLSFDLKPDRETENAPTITLKITIHGQRIYENQVPQALDGVVTQIIKVQSVASILTKTLYDSGPFENSGPLPPVAEKTTTFTLNFIAKAGVNALKDAVMTAELPQHVKWLNTVSEGDSITYNANTRMVTWDIGAIDANSMQSAYAQVSLTPSVMQIGTSPNLLEKQKVVGIDQFTGTKVTTSGSIARTNYYLEGSEMVNKGTVQSSE
jgi:hypothetical protein